MSTMRTDLLQNRLGTSHPAVTKATFVKGYAHINQFGPSFGMTFNASSLTDGGNGITYVELTAVMATVYPVVAAIVNNYVANYDHPITIFTSNRYLLCNVVNASSAVDTTGISGLICGDLA